MGHCLAPAVSGAHELVIHLIQLGQLLLPNLIPVGRVTWGKRQLRGNKQHAGVIPSPGGRMLPFSSRVLELDPPDLEVLVVELVLRTVNDLGRINTAAHESLA